MLACILVDSLLIENVLTSEFIHRPHKQTIQMYSLCITRILIDPYHAFIYILPFENFPPKGRRKVYASIHVCPVKTKPTMLLFRTRKGKSEILWEPIS